ncbi:MAG: amidohydrolase family protein [bacterium]|nr:amidohydrolase family protein [bacterium]
MIRTTFLPATCALFLGLAAAAASPSSDGDMVVKPVAVVLHDVVLELGDDSAHFDVRIEDGLIVDLAPTSDQLPAGARIIEGAGRLATPAFIDMWTATGCETPMPVATQDRPITVVDDVRAAMRTANRKGVQPRFRAVDVLAFGEKGAEEHREAGFGTLLSTPMGELLAGRSALCATGDRPLRDLVITPEVFQNGAFSAEGRGYPTTLMGYFAQLRQFFYDVERHKVLEARRRDGKVDPRTAWDPELDAGLRLVEGRELYVVKTRTATDVERWMRLADEFDLRIAIAGGRDAWRFADALAAKDIPVFLDLDWGKEYKDPKKKDKEKGKGKDTDADAETKPATMPEEGPLATKGAGEQTSADNEDFAAEETDAEAKEEPEKDASWKYKEPMALQLERRRLWEERRDNAIVLRKAGVRIFFGTGKAKPADFIDKLQQLVKAGLPAEYATAALTTEAARMLGVSNRLGQIATGRAATLCLWTADPMDKGAQLALIAVDGVIAEFEIKEKKEGGSGPSDGVDVSGRWDFDADSEHAPEGAFCELSMGNNGKVTGTYTMENPMESGTTLSSAVTGKVSGTNLTLSGSLDFGGNDVEFQIDCEINGLKMSGTNTITASWGEEEMEISGTQTPKHNHGILNWGYEHQHEDRYSCHQ